MKKTLCLVLLITNFIPLFAGEVPPLLIEQAIEQQEKEAREAKKKKEHKAATRKAQLQEAKQERKEGKALRSEESKLTAKQKSELMTKWKGEKLKRLKKDTFNGAFADLYNVPSWPVRSRPFFQNTMLDLGFEYSYAQKAFASGGKRRDLSHLIFGRSCFALKDVLPESRLLEQDCLAQYPMENADDNFLFYLRNAKINLQASHEQWKIGLDFVHYLDKKDVAVGVHFPLVHVKHDLDVNICVPQNALDPMTKTTDEGTLFRTTYGGDINRFVCDLLRRKGLTHRRNNSEYGLGDITLFGRAHLGSRSWDSFIVGINVLIPTGQHRSPHELWGPELGTGIPNIAVYTSLLTNLDYKVNPHIFAQVLFHVPTTLQRRVPRVVHFSGNTDQGQEISQQDACGQSIQDLFTFGELVAFKQDKSFCILESCIKELSGCPTRVRIRPGIAIDFRVGNIFEKFIFRRGFLDVYYHLHMQQRWKVSALNCCDAIDASIISQNTGEIAHKAGFEYSYQIDKSSRVRASLTFTFDGRNTPELLVFQAHYSFDF